MDQEGLQEMESQNREMEAQLTKRNEQYVFDLKKALKIANLTDEAQTSILHEILPQLVDGQKSGKTARQLFGTVHDCTQALLNRPQPVKESTNLQMWLDNSLMLLAMLAVITGLMEIFNKKNQAAFGLGSMIICAVTGGVAFLVLYRTIYQYDKPGADKTKKPKMLKSAAIMFGVLLLWIVSMYGVMFFMPISFNIQMEPFVNIILGVAAFGIRYLLKKKFNIQSGFFGAR